MPHSIRTAATAPAQLAQQASDEGIEQSAHSLTVVRVPIPSMSLEQAKRAFQEAQDAEGFTHKTQLSYAKVLVLLTRYLRDTYHVVEIAHVAPEHLRQWLIDLRHEPGRYGPRSS